jgi:hypothetical protein
MLADWPVTEETGPYQYRDVSDYDFRNPMDIGFCDCPCDSVIKSVKVYEDQEDDEVFLSAGYHIDEMRCQKIEIVVNACYQQTLSSINLNFNNGNPSDDCFNGTFHVFRSTGLDPATAVECSDFLPFSQNDPTGQFILVPPVNACSSATYTFYICSDYIDQCEHDDIPATLSVGDCDIDMMFHFDFYVGSQNSLQIDKISFKNKSINGFGHKKSYRIINLFNMEVQKGTVSSEFEFSELLKMVDKQFGLYVYQIFDNDKLIIQGKFINNQD